MKKVGRPKKWDPKSEIVKARLTKNDINKLDYIKDIKSLNTSDIIREAIDLYYEMNRFS